MEGGCFCGVAAPSLFWACPPRACPPGHPRVPRRSQLRVPGREAVHAPTAGGEGQEKGAWAGCVQGVQGEGAGGGDVDVSTALVRAGWVCRALM